MSSTSVVHIVRHGHVHNPGDVLYGRLPGFGLSELGFQMAAVLGEHFANQDLVHLVSSPLQRALETMDPIAAKYPALTIHVEERVIEAENVFEGRVFGKRYELLFRPSSWPALRNPLRPSWGEPYQEIAARMHAAIRDAHTQATKIGGDAVIVSHELPIWIARRLAEGKGFVHDPRCRHTRLASVTSFSFDAGKLVCRGYSEPAAALLASV